jgi:hypothetical protein
MAEKTDAAKKEILDAGAGAPASVEDAAADLPTKDKVQQAYHQQLNADSVAEEVAAKKTIVEESPDADETPSGAALLEVAAESDPVKQGEEYTKAKMRVRTGDADDAKR